MPPQPLAIVGVGASAGGLEAFSALLETVPRDLAVAWVLVQHLDPTQDSMMAELLARHSQIPVTEARANEPVRAGHVYVIPPDRFLSVDGDTLRLARPAIERGKRMAVDYLFRSLAEVFGRRAIGVVLSGTGGDGTHGLRAIKAAGGLTIAQDPATAAYDGMPRSAIEASAADLTLPLDKIAGAVASFLKHPYTREHDRAATIKDGAQVDRDDVVSEGDREQLAGVLEVLHDELGLDLSTYKLSTLGRRVQRRMGLTHITSMAEYRRRLSHDRQELHELARDVHVSVTDFFRDPEAFESLTRSALPKLFEQAVARPPGERSIRVWAPGCATGEEAYSIAIALHELRRERWPESGIGIQIFATDVDAQAIRVARMGVYTDACMANVSEQRRGQWFQQLDTPGQYRVRQHLRDSLSFAEHNVLSDPPFSKLDLISCRNLLIYLRRSAQERVLATFHFALESQGFLLLGPSEALGAASDGFRVVDKKWRLYQRLETSPKSGARNLPIFSARWPDSDPQPVSSGSVRPRDHKGETAALKLLARLAAPATVLVNNRHEILYLHGELSEFLDLPSGTGALSLLDMVRPDARTRVRAALYTAARQRHEVTTSGTLRTRSGQERSFTVKVTPCDSPELGDGLLMACFMLDEPQTRPPDEAAKLDTVNEELTREVEALRTDLQSTVDELEHANEELRTSNEESMTMNEELQSTNEELETQSEELRSVNEELVTVNSQLREKLEELHEAHADIANLLHSTKLPAIFLDRDFRIRRYTPEARKLLNVIESDIGRPLADLSGVCVEDGMLRDAREVIDGLAPVEKEIRDGQGNWYLRRILPYRTADDRIGGVVVTFSEVTNLKALAAEVTAQREQQRVVSEVSLRAMREYDLEALAQYATEAIAQTLHCPMCKLLELEPDGRRLRLIAGVGWQEGIVGSARVPNDAGSQAGFTLRQSGPVIVPDLDRETRFAGPSLLLDHGVRSGISVIIPGADHKPYGVLGAHSTEPRAFDAGQIDFVQQIANVLAGTIKRLAVEDSLQNSERRFRAMADNMSQLAWMTDAEGKIVWYNRRWLEYTGVTLEDMLENGWQRFHHPDYVDAVVAKVMACFDAGEEWEDTFPLRGADGQYRWFLSRAMPIHDAKGRVAMWFGTNTDITERRSIEQRLEESTRKLQAIIDKAPAAIYAKDLEGRYLLSNEIHAGLFDQKPQSMIGKTDHDLDLSRTQASEYRNNDLLVAQAGTPQEFEESIVIDGHRRSYISLKFPLWDREGRVYAVCGISTEITDRKREEQHLRTVMAELNHRVKNMLASVQALTRITASSVGSVEEFKKSLGERLASMGIAHSLLTRSEWRGARLADIVRSEIEPRIASSDLLTLDGPDVVIRPKSVLPVHMAVHELATNATKYGALASPGGTLALRWRVEPCDDGDELVIEWREAGSAAASHPAKEGFGTRMIRDMLAYELEGGVNFDFAGSGLIVTIRLPMRHADTQSSPLPSSSGSVPGWGRKSARPEPHETREKRLLLVEDNSVIARYMADFLEDLGYTVLGPAANVEKALALVAKEPPDLALLDVDLDGDRVYPVALELARRDVRFAFVTGYNIEDLPESLSDRPLFSKPLNLDSLTAWLADH